MNTNTNIATFVFKDQPVRTVVIDGDPWFVAADVCKVLGLTNPSYVVQRLDADEKASFKLGFQRGPAVNVVSAPGLFALIARSDRAEARAFDRWVRHTVLPAIMKDGMYVVGEEKIATGEMTVEGLSLLTITRLQAKIESIKAEAEAALKGQAVAVQKQDEMRVVFAKADHTVRDVARMLGPDVHLGKVSQSLAQAGYLWRTVRGTYRVRRKSLLTHAAMNHRNDSYMISINE